MDIWYLRLGWGDLTDKARGRCHSKCPTVVELLNMAEHSRKRPSVWTSVSYVTCSLFHVVFIVHRHPCCDSLVHGRQHASCLNFQAFQHSQLQSSSFRVHIGFWTYVCRPWIDKSLYCFFSDQVERCVDSFSRPRIGALVVTT